MFNGDTALGVVYKYARIPDSGEPGFVPGARLYVYTNNNPEIDDSITFILRKDLPLSLIHI